MGALFTGTINLGSGIEIPLLPVLYLLVISIISIIVCIYDKKVSKKNKVELRVPEKNLLLLSAFGGGVAMYITMLTIRHKTKHKKFMIGIPAIIIAQLAVAFFLVWLSNR